MHYHKPTPHPLPPTHIFPTSFSSTPQQIIIPIVPCNINLATFSIRNHQVHHQQQEQQDQELVIGSMDSHKNTNLETTHNKHRHILPSPSPSSQDFRTTHHQEHTYDAKKNNEGEGFITKSDILQTLKDGLVDSVSCSSLVGEEGNMTPPPPPPPQQEMVVVEESGRDRLKRHRVEMAGRVWIPDIWGHEDLLKDWIDCTVFDSSLGNKSIMSARASLVQERRRPTLRIENRC